MSEELIKKVQQFIDSGIGDKGRLSDILKVLNQHKPLYLSDYRYLQSLSSEVETEPNEKFPDKIRPDDKVKQELDTIAKPPLGDENPMTILKERLANGEISIEEFKTIKKALEEA